MTLTNLKYIHRFKDRHGKMRAYFRRKGIERVRLPGIFGSPEFLRAYQLALEGVSAKPLNIGASRAATRSISALIAAYYTSNDFDVLAEPTKKAYRNTLEKFRKEHGGKPVAGLEAVHVRRIIANASTPTEGNKLLMRIHTIMIYAVEQNWRKYDPTREVRKLKVKVEGYRTWSEHEITLFEQRWAIGTKQRLAFDLLLYTSQRSGDVRLMGPQNIVLGRMVLRQQKTGAEINIPIHERLRKSLDAFPSTGPTFLALKSGKAFSSNRFSDWMSKAIREAGLPPGLSPHGLRKSAATRLADAGCTDHQIMAFTGHKTLKEVARYTQQANVRRLSDAAIALLREYET